MSPEHWWCFLLLLSINRLMSLSNWKMKMKISCTSNFNPTRAAFCIIFNLIKFSKCHIWKKRHQRKALVEMLSGFNTACFWKILPLLLLCKYVKLNILMRLKLYLICGVWWYAHRPRFQCALVRWTENLELKSQPYILFS